MRYRRGQSSLRVSEKVQFGLKTVSFLQIRCIHWRSGTVNHWGPILICDKSLSCLHQIYELREVVDGPNLSSFQTHRSILSKLNLFTLIDLMFIKAKHSLRITNDILLFLLTTGRRKNVKLSHGDHEMDYGEISL